MVTTAISVSVAWPDTEPSVAVMISLPGLLDAVIVAL
jgi:hypothetical protein